jgi:hypothetical protein
LTTAAKNARLSGNPLVRKVVIHQRAGHPGAFGYLVDADVVIGSFSEDLCPQRQQLRAAILGG